MKMWYALFHKSFHGIFKIFLSESFQTIEVFDLGSSPGDTRKKLINKDCKRREVLKMIVQSAKNDYNGGTVT